MTRIHRVLAFAFVCLASIWPPAASMASEAGPCRAGRFLNDLRTIGFVANALQLLNGSEDPRLRCLLEWRLASAVTDARDELYQNVSVPAIGVFKVEQGLSDARRYASGRGLPEAVVDDLTALEYWLSKQPKDPPLPATSAPLPYVQRDICPFECCHYGKWTAESTVVVRKEARSESPVLFSIPAGETFEALTGEVTTLKAGKGIVLNGTPQFEPGTFIDLLGILGEAGYAAWYQGELSGVGYVDSVPSYLWGERGAIALLKEAPVTEWWVRVRKANGREGWVLYSEDLSIKGLDACSGE